MIEAVAYVLPGVAFIVGVVFGWAAGYASGERDRIDRDP